MSFDMEKVEQFVSATLGDTEGWAHAAFGINGKWIDGKYTFNHPDGEWRPAKYRWPEQREKLLSDIATIGHADVYLCPYVMQGATRTKGDAAKRPMVHVDRDATTGLEESMIRGLRLMVVNSGTPGHEHAYAKLDASLSVSEHDELCRMLGSVLGECDAKVSDNDVLRVPGTLNFKSDPPTPVFMRASWSDAPEWKPADLKHKIRQFAAIRDALEIDKGDRSDTMYGVVAAAFDAGLSKDAARELCGMHKRNLFSKQGSEKDFERIWAKLEAKNAASVAEADFWESRPELKHIRDFAKAKGASPWAVLGCTLVRIVADIKPVFVLPATIQSVASINLFAALVGGPADGKSGALRVSRDAVRIVGEHNGEQREYSIGTGEGLTAAYVRPVKLKDESGKITGDGIEQYNDRAIFLSMEVGTIRAIASRNGSTLMESLRRAWMGEALGFQYKARENRLPVGEHLYRLCLIVGVQPDSADVLLNPQEIGVGTPQRFLWLRAGDPGYQRRSFDDRPEVPEQMLWQSPESMPASYWGGTRDVGGFGRPVDWHGIMPLCDKGARIIWEANEDRNEGKVDALDGHLLLSHTKVAAALALFNGHWEITEQDWDLAQVVMDHSQRTRDELVDSLRAKAAKENEGKGRARAIQEVIIRETVENAVVEKVLTRIVDRFKGKGEVTHSAVRNSLSAKQKESLDEALDLGVEKGVIEVAEYESAKHAEPVRKVRVL